MGKESKSENKPIEFSGYVNSNEGGITYVGFNIDFHRTVTKERAVKELKTRFEKWIKLI